MKRDKPQQNQGTQNPILNRILLALKIVAAVAIIAAMVKGCDVYKDKKRAEKEHEIAAAEAVELLPPGVEDAWMEYIDNNLKKIIFKEGDIIRVNKIDVVDNKATIKASPHTDYKITCNYISGGSINFIGMAEEFEIYGFIHDLDKNSKQPMIGVADNSIAARHLREKICDKILTYMKGIMDPTAKFVVDTY
jgi:hypothetical protein